MSDLDADNIISILVAVLGVFGIIVGALLTWLFLRVSRLEGRVTRLTNLSHKWWEWAQDTITKYQVHRKPGSPDLLPIPTEDPQE